MPTGYTAKLLEEDLTFEQFALICARAFGTFIDLRDEPTDSEIPERFNVSEYHVKAKQDAETKLSCLQLMNPDDRHGYGQMKKDEAIQSYEKCIKEANVVRDKINAMAEKVEAWNPPTEQHIEMKTFMNQQLLTTFKHDASTSYYEKELANVKDMPAMAFYLEALKSAKRGVEYHNVKYHEELERTERNTKWLTQLRESLKKQSPKETN